MLLCKEIRKNQAFSGFKEWSTHLKIQMKQQLKNYRPALALRFSRISSWSQGCVNSKMLCPVISTCKVYRKMNTESTHHYGILMQTYWSEGWKEEEKIHLRETHEFTDVLWEEDHVAFWSHHSNKALQSLQIQSVHLRVFLKLSAHASC